MDSVLVLVALVLGFNASQGHMKSSTTSLSFVEQHLYEQACQKFGNDEARTFSQTMIHPIIQLVEASLCGHSLPSSKEEQNRKLKILLQDAQELRLLMLAEHTNPIHIVHTSQRFKPTPYLIHEIYEQCNSAAKISQLKRDQLDKQWQQVLTQW